MLCFLTTRSFAFQPAPAQPIITYQAAAHLLVFRAFSAIGGI
jgi:hypothetical protein